MKSFISFIWGLMFIVCAAVFSIQSIALDPDFYTTRYEQMELASDLNVSNQDLNDSIIVLLDYIQDERQDMDITITRNGQAVEAFNTKEKTHMVDVKALYQNAITVGIVCFVFMIGILVYFFVKEKKLMISYLSKGMIQASICLGIVLLFFGMWIVYDFTGFWTWFHTVFFSNDLWLLDPRTDFMICMLPEIIFNQLVISIIIEFVLMVAIALAFSIYYQFKKAPIGFDRK